MEELKETGAVALTPLQYTIVKTSAFIWPLVSLILWFEIGWLAVDNLFLAIVIAISCLPLTALSWFSYKILTGQGGHYVDEETTEE